MFISCALTLSAQEIYLNFHLLDDASGLKNHSYNSFIGKDSRNHIWISSQNGWYRFDGVRIKHYPIPGWESDQMIQSAPFEDREANLWFATYYDGIHYYDRATDQMISPHPGLLITEDGESRVITEEYHLFFFEEKDQAIWLRAGDFIWRYDIEKRTARKIIATQGKRFAVISDDEGYPTRILACTMTREGGIEIITLDKKKNSPPIKQMYFQGQQHSPIKIQQAIVGDQDIVWLLSNQGLIEFDLKYRSTKQIYSPLPSQNFYCWDGLTLTDHNSLLISARENGLWQFDLASKKFISHWPSQEITSNQKMGTQVQELYLDNENQLWLSLDGVGVAHASILVPSFPDPFHKNLAATKVTYIEQDWQGRIWTLSRSGGIYVFSASGRLLKHIEGEPFKSNGTFQHLSIDAGGAIWLVKGNDLYRADISARVDDTVWEYLFTSPQEIVSLYHGFSDRILVITRSGIFDLIHTAGNYSLERNTSFLAHQQYEFNYFFDLGAGRTLIPFAGKELWLAGQRNGRVQIMDTIFINAYTYDAFAFPDSDTIWLSTSNGLLQYDGQQIQSVLPTTSLYQGITVYQTIADRKNNFWLITNKGLIRYHITKNEFNLFTETEGLPSDLFDRSSNYVASDGKIWLGTDCGLVVFHPDSIRHDNIIPKARIEQMWINNIPYESDTVISETDAVALSYRQNTLAFELRAVGFQQPTATSVDYRMMGYDTSWVNVANGGFARFTQVPPGRYTLQIRAVNAAGLKGHYENLALRISPPFWQTWWFRLSTILAAVLLISTVVALYYRRKLKAERELLEREKTIAAERNRIAKELHDDLGSNLSSILYLGEDLLEATNKQEATRSIDRIKNLAQSAIGNMQEIIWALDSRKNNLQEVAIYLRKVLIQFAEDHHFALRAEFPERDLSQIELGAEKRRNIILIVREGLHNILKHAEAQQITFQLQVTPTSLTLILQDNGKGFDPQDSSTTHGHGLYNMPGRATSIGGQLQIRSTVGEGTELLLWVPV